jgi:hypothetical protein
VADTPSIGAGAATRPELDAAPPARATELAPLAVRLRLSPDGPVVASEPVRQRDLVDSSAELWFEGILRRGHVDVTLGSMRAELLPVHREAGSSEGICDGFDLVARDPEGREASLYFSRDSLGPVAARGARGLLERGVLEPGQLYYFDLEPVSPSACSGDARVVGPEGRGAPELLELPLAPLLERAGAAPGSRNAVHYPVLFTREARERAERISRKGAAANPAVETGGLLVGPLCRCPDAGEVFAIVLDVLEATGSEATTYSLSYSGETWARIQTVLRARRRHPATRHHRLLGQTHGHNFLPFGGAAPCEACEHVAVCTRTSAYLSEDDRTWCRSVFSAEPWQLSLVYGHDARGRNVSAFYGQQGGSLVHRSYHVVDRVDDLIEGMEA